jgi:hypothetical protein
MGHDRTPMSARPLACARRALGLSAIAAGLVLSATAPALGAVTHPGSLKRTLASALAASRSESSVFWKGVTTADGATVVETTNAGTSHGNQTVTVTVGTRNAGSISIELFGNTVYLKGDTADALLFQGFTPAAASAEANQWISVPSSQPFYAVVAAGLTVKSTVQELDLTGQLTQARRTKVLGRSVIGIKGTLSVEGVTGPAVLYVRRHGTPLPVEETMSEGGVGVVTLGRWGEPVTIGSPPAAVAFDPSWVEPSSGGGGSTPSPGGPIAV